MALRVIIVIRHRGMMICMIHFCMTRIRRSDEQNVMFQSILLMGLTAHVMSRHNGHVGLAGIIHGRRNVRRLAFAQQYLAGHCLQRDGLHQANQQESAQSFHDGATYPRLIDCKLGFTRLSAIAKQRALHRYANPYSFSTVAAARARAASFPDS